jgi:hypothetical protein
MIRCLINWKDMEGIVVASFIVLFWHLSGGTEGEKMKAFRIACLQAEI